MERVYSKRELFSRDLTQLENYIQFVKGYGLTQGEAYRTVDQQRIYSVGWSFSKVVQKWLKSPSEIRSWVKISQHQKRLGKDEHIWSIENPGKYISDEEWIEIGRYWCLLSSENRWGGNFGLKKSEYFTRVGKDRWHFERRG